MTSILDQKLLTVSVSVAIDTVSFVVESIAVENDTVLSDAFGFLRWRLNGDGGEVKLWKDKILLHCRY